ncbi:MAG TPA: hypothetical protein VKV28_06590 [Candidatus Binataceae bacterium]|nr:hypothetical protein [Candidatus Binataceae bacterium]
MKAIKTVLTAAASALALSAVAIPTWASTMPTPTTQSQARQLLDRVTHEVDQTSFGFINNPQPERQDPYMSEYSAGLKAYQSGNYDAAVKALNQAEQDMKTTREWAERR